MKKRDVRGDIRKILRAHPDGLTVSELIFKMQCQDDQIRKALKAMPDVYIDRWVFPTKGASSAVWCAVEVPEDCPRPSYRERPEVQQEKRLARQRIKNEKAKQDRQEERQRKADLRHLANLSVIRGSWPYPNQPH